MTPVEIVDVTLSDLDIEQLQRRNIEAPKRGSQVDSDEFILVGWVISQSSLVETVEVVHKETIIRRVTINVNRPDVAAAFPEVADAEHSGFRTTVTVPDTSESELRVRAVLQDESRVPLGVIVVRRSQSGEEQYGESGVQDQPEPLQDQSGPATRFFRRLLGRGGG